MPELTRDVPDDATRAQILALAARVGAEDGAPPLSDQTLTRLGAGDVEHVLARESGDLVGYAQRADGVAEIAADPPAVAPLLAAVRTPGLLVWSHGRRSRLAAALKSDAFEPVRELRQLRRPAAPLPADPPLAEGVRVRAFEPGRDDDAWLAVNAAAFAHHPEQGSWTRADLAARVAEAWFDPGGFLLAERDGALLGYHWTKVHPDGLGEVYVLGVAPAAQGLGLGKGLLVRGLRYLQERGCTETALYVEADNAAALALYAGAGFVLFDLDVQWRSA